MPKNRVVTETGIRVFTETDIRVFTKTDIQVLEMINLAHEKVSTITESVDYHKRFDKNDIADPYGKVIEWLHFKGRTVFGDK